MSYKYVLPPPESRTTRCTKHMQHIQSWDADTDTRANKDIIKDIHKKQQKKKSIRKNKAKNAE